MKSAAALLKKYISLSLYESILVKPSTPFILFYQLALDSQCYSMYAIFLLATLLPMLLYLSVGMLGVITLLLEKIKARDIRDKT